MDCSLGVLNFMRVRWNGGGQLFVCYCDSGSATVSEVRAFPIGGVISSLVEDVTETVEDRVFSVFLSSRYEL